LVPPPPPGLASPAGVGSPAEVAGGAVPGSPVVGLEAVDDPQPVIRKSAAIIAPVRRLIPGSYDPYTNGSGERLGLAA
jgi:hypothetical protein